MSITITETTTPVLNNDDLKVGDRLVLKDDSNVAAHAGAFANVTGFNGEWVNVKWDRETNELAGTQMDGGYEAETFELVTAVAPFTVEDKAALDALPVGTILRLATDHLLVKKVAPFQRERYFGGFKDYEYVWHAQTWITGEPCTDADTMVRGSGWLPATIENPEILGEFQEQDDLADWERELLEMDDQPAMLTIGDRVTLERDSMPLKQFTRGKIVGLDFHEVIIKDDGTNNGPFRFDGEVYVPKSLIRVLNDRQRSMYYDLGYLVEAHIIDGDGDVWVEQPSGLFECVTMALDELESLEQISDSYGIDATEIEPEPTYLYREGDRVLVTYAEPGSRAFEIWSGPATVTEDVVDTSDYLVVHVRTDRDDREGAFPLVEVEPLTEGALKEFKLATDPDLFGSVEELEALTTGTVFIGDMGDDTDRTSPWVACMDEDDEEVVVGRMNRYACRSAYDETGIVKRLLEEGHAMRIVYRP